MEQRWRQQEDKGFFNTAQQNNCFLNADLQILWHLLPFRRGFKAVQQQHTCVPLCVVCALTVCLLPPFILNPTISLLLACHEQLRNKCRTNPFGFPLAHSTRPPLSSIPSTSDGAPCCLPPQRFTPSHSSPPTQKITQADAGEVFVALLEAIHASSGDEAELRDPARECCVAHKVYLPDKIESASADVAGGGGGCRYLAYG